ncbi:MAG: hypothetical protein HQK89_07295 [Nitrospirae bacterium]|nr:hypothetical protein [Nitrospirota bacterium]
MSILRYNVELTEELKPSDKPTMLLYQLIGDFREFKLSVDRKHDKMVVKDDIMNLATKADIKDMVTKADIKDLVDSICREFRRIFREELDRVKTRPSPDSE